MEVKEIRVNRKDVEFIVGKSKLSDENTKLSLYKNEDTHWILTDGWRGVSYFIKDEATKIKLQELKY